MLNVKSENDVSHSEGDVWYLSPTTLIHFIPIKNECNILYAIVKEFNIEIFSALSIKALMYRNSQKYIQKNVFCIMHSSRCHYCKFPGL